MPQFLRSETDHAFPAFGRPPFTLIRNVTALPSCPITRVGEPAFILGHLIELPPKLSRQLEQGNVMLIQYLNQVWRGR